MSLLSHQLEIEFSAEAPLNDSRLKLIIPTSLTFLVLWLLFSPWQPEMFISQILAKICFRGEQLLTHLHIELRIDLRRNLELFPTSLDTCAFSPPPLVYVFIAPFLFLPLLNMFKLRTKVSLCYTWIMGSNRIW